MSTLSEIKPLLGKFWGVIRKKQGGQPTQMHGCTTFFIHQGDKPGYLTEMQRPGSCVGELNQSESDAAALASVLS